MEKGPRDDEAEQDKGEIEQKHPRPVDRQIVHKRINEAVVDDETLLRHKFHGIHKNEEDKRQERGFPQSHPVRRHLRLGEGNAQIGQRHAPRSCLFQVPSSEQQQPDCVDPEEPPDDGIDHHHGERVMNRRHVFVKPEEHEDQGQVKPQQDAVYHSEFSIVAQRAYIAVAFAPETAEERDAHQEEGQGGKVPQSLQAWQKGSPIL